MSKSDNEALSSRFLKELWNQQNLSIVDDLIALNYVDHTPRVLPTEPLLQGPDAVKQLASDYFHRFPRILVLIDDQIAQGNQVVTRMTWTVTFKLQSSPYDQQVMVNGVGIDRIVDDKIVENWNTLDVLYRLNNIQLIDEHLGPTQITPAVPPLPCNPPSCPANYFCWYGNCWRV